MEESKQTSIYVYNTVETNHFLNQILMSLELCVGLLAQKCNETTVFFAIFHIFWFIPFIIIFQDILQISNCVDFDRSINLIDESAGMEATRFNFLKKNYEQDRGAADLEILPCFTQPNFLLGFF